MIRIDALWLAVEPMDKQASSHPILTTGYSSPAADLVGEFTVVEVPADGFVEPLEQRVQRLAFLPKGECMSGVTQARCDFIAHELNTRPRKRHAYSTPADLYQRY